jgi:aspartyl-tRNA(Asn)/glutamyl-tRNA(Gln) amidotransferase subunit C
MSKIGTAEVERLAKLARIGLTTEETEQFAAELGQIVEFVEQLQKVKVDGVEPTDQVTGLTSVLRDDVVRPASQTREQLLANAPDQEDGYIKVTRVRE